jgi:hypothetical protein
MVDDHLGEVGGNCCGYERFGFLVVGVREGYQILGVKHLADLLPGVVRHLY